MNERRKASPRKRGSRAYQIKEPTKAPLVEEHSRISLAHHLTAVFEKVPLGYIGHVEEVPGANTQGKTLVETKANLREALALVLAANREMAEQALGTRKVIREPFGNVLA